MASIEGQKVIIENEGGKTEAIIGRGVIEHTVEIASSYTSLVLMVSSRVASLYSSIMPRLETLDKNTVVLNVQDGESLKSIKNYQKIMRVLVEREVDRHSLLIYIGGGTVGDLAGFVAATYKRGIDLLAVPTTLLAQVDSSVGGKNGINFAGVKNVIGTFYQPRVILDEISFLLSAPDEVLRNGLPEVIKYAFIGEQRIGALLSEAGGLSKLRSEQALMDIVSWSVKYKASVTAGDYRDRSGLRAALNFGHTVGHALEAASGNSIGHGEAVALGMLVESFAGQRYGITPRGTHDKIADLISMYGIRLPDLSEYRVDGLVRYMMNDKKTTSGTIRFYVPAQSNTVSEMPLSQDQARRVLREYIQNQGGISH